MYAILGEDDSDAKSIMNIVRILHKSEKISVATKGYRGCAELLRKGCGQLKDFSSLGRRYFIVVYDSDSSNPEVRKKEVFDKIIEPSGVAHSNCCIVIPVQELEAWILADLEAIKRAHVCCAWNPAQSVQNPERIQSPKEYLEKISRDEKKRSRYAHVSHNPVVASHLDLDIVAKKCPSFHPLRDFVNQVESGII